MLNISIYGDHNLTVESIIRLLQDETRLNIHPVKIDTLCEQQSGQDVFIYCANGYSNTLVKEIKKLHQVNPDMKKILVISMAHKHFLKKLLHVGINSIVSYKCTPEELFLAIKYAITNQQYLSSDLSKMVIKSKYPSCFNSLSQRELEITYLLANGMNIQGVSNELDISPKTVNTYRYRIFNKLAIDRNIDLFRMVSEEAAYMLKGFN